MYLARTTGLRSVDLSRQVGAAVFTSSNEIVSLGCNEVPKPLGGTYWTGDHGDARDIEKGFDSNERIKRSLLVDFTRRLKDNNFLSSGIEEGEVARFILNETSRGGRLRDTQLMDLLEFGRMIHAEMSAICDAARIGRSIKGSTLYCTTFPCHMCAKHIVASGIKRVVYIEPYPKSYAEQLHGDAIVVGRYQPEEKVVFEPFIGISPFRYRDLFARERRRKEDDGVFKPWIEDGSRANRKIYRGNLRL
jgi:deoxycytidylate deaminase